LKASKDSFFLRINKWGLFSFFDKDHMDYNCGDLASNVKESLKRLNISQDSIHKIYLLTNLRVLGYVFNPVSFYFIQNQDEKFTHCLIEVGNTFGEQKPYLVDLDQKGEGFLKTPKEFYVSPFISLDSFFIFKVAVPQDHFSIEIDSLEKDGRLFQTKFTGRRVPLTKKNLILRFFSFPMITLKIILAIHLQALKLFLKKVPYINKTNNPELQKEVLINKRVSI
jgi:DUF1365 family protein